MRMKHHNIGLDFTPKLNNVYSTDYNKLKEAFKQLRKKGIKAIIDGYSRNIFDDNVVFDAKFYSKCLDNYSEMPNYYEVHIGFNNENLDISKHCVGKALVEALLEQGLFVSWAFDNRKAVKVFFEIEKEA